MSVEKKRRAKAAILDKILGTVYNTKHMISLHYFDRQIELERAFTRSERVLSMFVKQQLRRGFIELSRAKATKTNRSNRAVIFLTNKLVNGFLKGIVIKLRRSSTIGKKLQSIFLKSALKRVFADISVIFQRLKMAKQNFSRLDRLMRKEQSKRKIAIFYVLKNCNNKATVDVVKNYDISNLNEITKQARMSSEVAQIKPSINNNYTSFQHKQNPSPALGDSNIDNTDANSDIVIESIGLSSPRSVDLEEVLAHKRMLVDESELFMRKPAANEFNEDRNHAHLVSERYQDQPPTPEKIIQGNYFDYLNSQSMKQSVNASFTSSQTNMKLQEESLHKDIHPQFTDSNSLLEYKKPKRKLVKAQPAEENSSDERKMAKIRNKDFAKDENAKRDRSKEKIAHALAAIQEKLDQLTAAQERNRTETMDERSTNRSFMVFNKGEQKPKNFEVEHSYMGCYIDNREMSSPMSQVKYNEQLKDKRSRFNSYKKTKSEEVNHIDLNISPIAHSAVNKFPATLKSPISTTPARVFSFNNLAPQEIKEFKFQMSHGEFSSLQNFAVLLNFFVARRLKSKYADILTIISKVVQRSKNIARIRDKLDKLYHGKMIKDFVSASVFQRKKLNKGCELVQILVKNQKRKLISAIKILLMKRGSFSSTSNNFENISEINRYVSVSKTNKLFSRINLPSNNLDISEIKDEFMDDSFDKLQDEYEHKVLERQKRTTSFYSNIKNL